MLCELYGCVSKGKEARLYLNVPISGYDKLIALKDSPTSLTPIRPPQEVLGLLTVLQRLPAFQPATQR